MSDWVATVIFTLESLLKIIAFGFVMSPKTYLRDGWNQLDFIVVLAAWFSKLPELINFKILRSLRLLRPLKSLSKLEQLRILVNSILKSLPGLVGVGAILAFFMSLFALGGMQFFEG